MTAYELALSILRSGPVTALARRLSRGRLRILAYHGVPDPDRFAEQMEYLAGNYAPVGEGDVVAALAGVSELPDGAAWVTFDDGDPSVVANGLPTLVRLGIPATMFVCPGLIESGEPFWWRVTDHAPERALAACRAAGVTVTGADPTAALKLVDDERRRQVVAELLGELDGLEGSAPPDWRQLDDGELDRWLGAGMALGNHSWDHPCLDRCSPAEQVDQVRRADEWLTVCLGAPPRSFAYPNGNFSEVVDGELRALSYDVGLLYDNRLTDLDSLPSLQLSRLMLEADQPAARLVGVLSGAQPAIRRFLGGPRGR